MAASKSKQTTYQWEGKDKKGKVVKGEMLANGDSFVKATLRRQGINVTKVKNKAALPRKEKLPIKISPCSPAN